jgi:hypothetical protein
VPLPMAKRLENVRIEESPGAGRPRPPDGYTRETPSPSPRPSQADGEGACPAATHLSKVETWRELPDGEIEFTMKRLGSAD